MFSSFYAKFESKDLGIQFATDQSTATLLYSGSYFNSIGGLKITLVSGVEELKLLHFGMLIKVYSTRSQCHNNGVELWE